MATLTVADPVPSPYEDAEQIKDAFKGWGTDEEKVISIIAHRDAAQRKQIFAAYEEYYNESLRRKLEKELNGDLERAVYRWMFEPLEREALLVNIALVKDIDFRVIVETACANSPDELLAVKRAYQYSYKKSIEEDVAVHAEGDLRRLLFALVSTYRYDGPEVDMHLAQSEAKAVHEAITKKEFLHEEVIRILSTRSKAQLKATFNRFQDDFGSPITEVFANEKSGDLVSALEAAIQCLLDPHMYYAELLRRSLSKSGAGENELTRVIVTRAERDLQQIKELYYERSSVTLEQAVSKETSGQYKVFLLALIGSSSL